MKEAIDKAIEQYPGAVGLADGVVKSNNWWIPFIYGQDSYIVEGTPLYVDDSSNEPTGKLESTNSQQLPTYQQSTVQQNQNSSVMFFHEVKNDETLQSIAKQYGIGLADLIKWNQLSSSKLTEGTILKIFLN